MEELRDHLICAHKKEKHNWMVEEVKAEFSCDECEIVFPMKSMLESHLDLVHHGDKGIVTSAVSQTVIVENKKEGNLQNGDNFCCEKCVKVFKKKYLLVMHRLKDHKHVNAGDNKNLIVELCDICNNSFDTPEGLQNHVSEEHTKDDEPEIIEEDGLVNSDEYKLEEYPKETDEKPDSVWVEEDSPGYQGMTMKGEGPAYKDACTALKSQLVKGKVFKDAQGRQLTILEVPKGNKPIEVEVTTMSKKPNAKRGKAKIHMWKPRQKKPCTIMVTLYTGSNYIFVQTVMNKFVKPFIDALISEPDEDPLSQYRVKVQDKTVGKENVTSKSENQIKEEKCEQCDTMCKGKRGLGIHAGKMHSDIRILVEDRKRKYGEDKDLIHIVDSNTPQVDEASEPIKESEVKEDYKEIKKLCSDCDIEIKAGNGKDLILETINHQSVCAMRPVIKKAPVTIELVSSPPHKKIKETEEGESDVDMQDIENILHNINITEANDKNQEISEEEKIPGRLKSMLKIKGLDINEHKLIGVGGGGKCGLNCVSLHTTGSEELSDEIAANKNVHIVENWENIYKNSFEFPYTERIGGGTRTFNSEDEFLTFLLTEKDNASAMWMTHTGMQAVSTMLNLNISILTTGLAPPVSNICVKCKPQQVFTNEKDLRKHRENVHHRVESEEEKEGRIQKARWTHLKPDKRIIQNVYDEKPEELVLLHDDEVHYNLIVHKNHNIYTRNDTFKKHIEKDHCDQKTNEGWQTVGKKGKVIKKYNIPVQNKYEILTNTDDKEGNQQNQINFKCDVCSINISTKSMLKTHLKVHKIKPTAQDPCTCTTSKEYAKMQAEIKTLRKELENSNSKLKVLENCSALKPNADATQKDRSVNQVRQSVITYRCKNCNFTCKTVDVLNSHIKKHDTQIYQCQLCDITFSSDGLLTQHMLNEHRERFSQLNCNMCSFQSSDKNEFAKHVTKHGKTDTTINIQLKHWKCRNCEASFESKSKMMDHRRDNHEMPMCFYDMEGKCKQLPGKCWYKHKSSQVMKPSSNSTKCFSCKNEFPSLGSMMDHRKVNHPEIVKQCIKFAIGECERESCWFLHGDKSDDQGFQETSARQEAP